MDTATMASTPTLMPPAAEMARAFLAGDASYDGVFLTAVRTTGIFCRPSCPARKPRPENVEFFATSGEALHAGYRPCRRCRPLDAETAPEWASRLLHALDEDPARRWTDQDLIALGVEPGRARRWFRGRYGLTFQAFARRRRLNRALERLRDGETLDDVAYDHGYESLSGFRDAFARLFAAPPGRARRGVEPLAVAWLPTPLGPMLGAADREGVRLLEFLDRRALPGELERLVRRAGAPLVPGDNDLLSALRRELDEYFAGTRRVFAVPLRPRGTDFERRVWDALLAIPYGETRSYEAVARAVGDAAAVRAVGRANGANAIAIAIPCHRVVRKSGELGGYGGGLWRKRLLLAHERGERSLAQRGDGPPGDAGTPGEGPA